MKKSNDQLRRFFTLEINRMNVQHDNLFTFFIIKFLNGKITFILKKIIISLKVHFSHSYVKIQSISFRGLLFFRDDTQN